MKWSHSVILKALCHAFMRFFTHKNYVSHMENVEGRKAVLDINIPALNTRNAKVRRPT
jgi:hypothetical protein